MRGATDVVETINGGAVPPIPAPPYTGSSEEPRIALSVPSMRNHTTDEGWQLFLGLEHSGYSLCGFGINDNLTDCREIMDRCQPGTLFIQDKREWLGQTAGGPRTFDHRETYRNVMALNEATDAFKVSVLKDAHNDELLNKEFAQEAGIHAWAIYYHPQIVSRLAGYVRPQHLIRTWHSVDFEVVPKCQSGERWGCIVSGAICRQVYPLRSRIFQAVETLRKSGIDIRAVRHPGYGRQKAFTPEYLNMLSQFKVAVCTSSIYGYALRKIIEATACGCTVVTDLPHDEVMPEIDGNLVRIDPHLPINEIADLLQELAFKYDAERQRCWAECARWYDYRAAGLRLAADIETMRKSYRA